MFAVLFVVCSFVVAQAEFHIQHRVQCVRKQICNGNLMCASVCERGSVEVDPWITNSLSYQKKLQTLYGGKNLDQGDDIGEGVCQFLSLTDQLRMGIRHLEIDIWWGPIKDEIQVCHSPVPLYPVGNITRTAEDRGINLEWDPKKMSCLGTKRTLRDVLTEVRDWMVLPENLEEIVMIYYDTKFYLSPEQVNWANNLMIDIFGSMIYKASEGNPLLKLSPHDLLSSGKRILFENQKEWWTKSSTNQTSDQIVFYPALWTHQFSANSLVEFPDCSIEGDHDWYGNQWVRALDGSFIEAATRCGVQIASGDYTNPDDVKFYVWSWDFGQPSAASGCVAILPSGRWATLDCSLPLPYACVEESSVESGLKWSVDLEVTGPYEKAVCPESHVFAAPHNGFSNSLLVNAGLGQTMWLNAWNPLKNT